MSHSERRRAVSKWADLLGWREMVELGGSLLRARRCIVTELKGDGATGRIFFACQCFSSRNGGPQSESRGLKWKALHYREC
jgi:hypothetical protein